MGRDVKIDGSRIGDKQRELEARRRELAAERAARSAELAEFDPARELLLAGVDLKAAAARRSTLERAIVALAEEEATLERALALLAAERARLELEHLHEQAPAVVQGYEAALRDIAAKLAALQASLRAAAPVVAQLDEFGNRCDAVRSRIVDSSVRPPLFGFAFDRGAALWLYRYLDEVIVQSSSEWARGHAALTEQIRAAAGLVRA